MLDRLLACKLNATAEGVSFAGSNFMQISACGLLISALLHLLSYTGVFSCIVNPAVFSALMNLELRIVVLGVAEATFIVSD
jgi:hypothetical protein